MEEAVFVNGVPRRVTPADIRRWHLTHFPRLAADDNKHILLEAIEAVYTIFSGSETLFDLQPKQVWYDKTLLLFRLLACWYIADQYPTFVSGSPLMGPLPLKAKKIGGVNLIFQDNYMKGQNENYQDLLGQLKSNAWGSKAYLMIRASGKRIMIGGAKRA